MVGAVKETLGNNGPRQKSQLIVELVGLAGTGKTSLAKALSQHNENYLISPDLQLRKIKHFFIFVGNIPFLLPLFLRYSSKDRLLTWEEIKAIVYLTNGAQIINQQTAGNGEFLLLDHGPIFKLAMLNAYGPESLKNKGSELWWQEMYKQWTCTLDIIIWLDAPDPILKERINSRQQKHLVKERSEEEVYKFLTQYRESYKLILEKLMLFGRPTLRKFDTNQQSIDQIVDEVITACNLKSTQLLNKEQEGVIC